VAAPIDSDPTASSVIPMATAASSPRLMPRVSRPGESSGQTQKKEHERGGAQGTPRGVKMSPTLE
jgi:hypothetical protein